MKTTSLSSQLSSSNEGKSTSFDNAIEIKGLKKSFEENAVLKGFDLSLSSGENLVVLGKSGSGKSVLIKCIVGLIAPDEGTISILGENVLELEDKSLNDLRKKIGFLFQSAALYDSMTVRENLEFPLRNSHSIKNEELEIKSVQNMVLFV